MWGSRLASSEPKELVREMTDATFAHTSRTDAEKLVRQPTIADATVAPDDAFTRTALLPPVTGAVLDAHRAASSLASPRLTVVIPMYNESERIGATISTLAGGTMNRSDVQFLLVDDGSTDDSPATVISISDQHRFARPVQVLVDPVNRGKGATVRRGMLSAVENSSAYVAFLDADLSLDPAVLDRAISLLVDHGADVVVGERIVDRRYQPILRRMFSLSFTRLARAIAPTGVRDTQCACKVFTASAADALFRPLATEGFAFDVETMVRARRAGMNVVQFPVAWQHVTGSRVNPVTDALKMLRDVWKIRRALAR
jgi:dolichyl-phosphate beta-glucosyltransferase